MIYDGIARGRKRITSKKFLPLKLLVETNQAGIIPKKKERIMMLKKQDILYLKNNLLIDYSIDKKNFQILIQEHYIQDI